MLSACRSLYQDWLGKDRFIESVNKHWLEASISVPLAISFLVFWTVAVVFLGAKSSRPPVIRAWKQPTGGSTWEPVDVKLSNESDPKT